MDVQSDAALMAMAPGSGVEVPNKGYPKEIMVTEIEDKFCCGYCNLILRNPKQSQCGHRFCAPCCTTMAKEKPPQICKSCIEEGVTPEETKLNFQSMFEDKAAIREMKKLTTKCPNAGCNWKGPFQEYIKHEDECEKKMVVCTMCGDLVSKAKLLTHQTKSCIKRKVTCPYCQAEFICSNLEKHQQTCPEFKVKCDKCSVQVKRKELKTHRETECAHRVVQCPVPDCKVKAPIDQYVNHFTKSPAAQQKHMAYMLEKISQLQEEISRLGPQESAVGGASGVGGATGASYTPEARPNFVYEVAAEGAVSASTSNSLDTNKLKLHEDLMAVLHSEILRCINKVESLDRRIEKLDKSVPQNLSDRLNSLERNLGLLSMKVDDVSGPQSQETGSLVKGNNGQVLWKIDAFSQIRRTVVNGRSGQEYITSPPFYTGKPGYKLRLKLFPNGDSSTRGKFLSVFVQVLKGKFDNLLAWPFNAQIYLALVDTKDLKEHLTTTFKSNPDTEATRRPELAENPAFGAPDFCTLEKLAANLPRYAGADSIILRALVDVKEDKFMRRVLEAEMFP